jgi:hypothetical protein
MLLESSDQFRCVRVVGYTECMAGLTARTSRRLRLKATANPANMALGVISPVRVNPLSDAAATAT